MIDALAAITADPDRLTRLYLTPEHKRAAHLVGDWMRRAGLAVRMDAAGDHARAARARRSARGARKRLLIGSHIDTSSTPAAMTAISASSPASSPPRRSGRAASTALRRLEILAFGDEEGVRFPKTLFGSSTIAGVLEPAMLDLVDADGIKIGDALARVRRRPRRTRRRGLSRERTSSAISRSISSRGRCWSARRGARRRQRDCQPGPLSPDRARRGRSCRHRADGSPPGRAGRGCRDHDADRGDRARRCQSDRWSRPSARSRSPRREQRHSRRGPLQPRLASSDR